MSWTEDIMNPYVDIMRIVEQMRAYASQHPHSLLAHSFLVSERVYKEIVKVEKDEQWEWEK